MKNILIALCCVFSLTLNAQQPVNGPSNQSFNYNSLVNSAFNPSNGTANITIPISSISEGSINHAVALVSNTDAPKSGEMASTVGLGWSLSAGGMISRSIRGLSDDLEGGYYTVGGYGIDINEVKDGDRDSEPDMYFFNAGSFSGSFTIDEDGDFHTIPKSRVKIEVILNSSGNFTNFVITDDLGTKYHFGLSDPNLIYHGLERDANNQVEDIISGWMLNKIESLDGELLFEYEVALSSTLYISEQLIHTYVDVDNNNEVINSDLIKTGNLTATDDVFRAAHIMTFVPKKIISKTRTIEFTYTNERDDIGPSVPTYTDEGYMNIFGKRLTEIKIVDGDLVDCNIFSLNHSYFIDNSTPISSWNYLPRVSKRLKFDNLVQKSCSGLELPPTIIEYYGGDFFPNQFNVGIDHWGYYNGANNGENLIKGGFSVTVNNFASSSPFTFDLSSPGNGNRTPNLTATMNGAIKKINYPTGGSVSYDYELNTESTVLTDLELFNLTASAPCDENLPACCDWIYSEYTSPIFFSSDIIENGTITLNLNPFFPSSCDPLNSELVLTVYETSLTTEITSLSINYNPPVDNQTSLIVDVSDINELESQHHYRFRLKSRNANSGTFAKLEVPSTMSNNPVGGLRVSKITTHDGIDAAKDMIVEYDYSENDNSSISSGKSFLPHDLYYNIPFDITPQVLFHYSPQHSFHNFYGSHVTYERVKTINNERGYSISKLKSISENYDAQYPLVPQPYNNQLGFLETNEVYNSEDELLSKNTNVQNDDDLFNIHNTEIYSLRIAPFYDYFNEDLVDDYIYKSDYSIKNGIARIKNSTSNMEGQEYTTEYVYFTGSDAEKCFAPQYTKIIDDHGFVYENRHKYTFDYDIDTASPQNNDGDDSYCIRDKINVLNLVGLLWQTETRYDGVLIAGSRKKIKLYDVTTGERVLCNDNAPSNTTLKLWKDYRIENTWIDGSFVNNGWQPLKEIERYDRIDGGGKLRSPEKTRLDQWQNYTENVYDNLNRLSQTEIITTVANAQPTFLSSYTYYGTSGLINIYTSSNGTSSTYEYDAFLRKYKETNCHGVETTTTYDINGISGNLPNNIITTTTDYTLNSVNTDPVGLSQITSLASKNYMDGLGRTVQTIGLNQAQDVSKDLISINEFDSYGNNTKLYYQYESVAGNDGQYTTPPLNLKNSTQVFEESPLNRAKSAEPNEGLDEVVLEYGSNVTSDNVIFHNSLSQSFYNVGALKKTVSIDQNNHKSISFTNRFGKLVLSRREDETSSERSDTYYLYDAKHRLVMVIPPGANESTTPELLYEYSYYGNDKLRSKKIPGADEVLYLYNDRELLAATQDGNMRAEDPDKWLANEYDEHGRLIRTGFIYETLSNENFINPNITEDLTKHTFYPDTHRPLKDEYRVLGTSDFVYREYTYNVCGDLKTSTSNSFENYHPNDFYIETFVYDQMGNIIEKANYLIYTESSNYYNFKERYKYDESGRLSESLIKYANEPWKPISSYEYDDQDRITTKYHGRTNSDWLQKIDYAYTDFGQLKSINGSEINNNDVNVDYHDQNFSFGNTNSLDQRDLFQQELFYDEQLPSNLNWSETANNTKNGNIKATIWQNRGKRQAAYVYNYSYKNELESAEFYKENSNSSIEKTDDHSVFFTYSDYGIITDLTRNHKNSITQIANSLIPNSGKIESMTVNGSIFNQHYDSNSNMKNYKNYRFDYNYLGLPTHKYEQEELILYDLNDDPIYSYGPSTTLASYQYLADGSKLQNWTFNTPNGENTKFIGIFEKFTSFETEKLRVKFDGGYLSIDPSTNAVLEEIYTISDHLGNIRVSYKDADQNGEIDDANEVLSINDFYPYGKRISDFDSNSDQLYGYNGIENDKLIADFDLSLASYRSLNAETGMWMQVDPKAESAYGHSPYNSMFNNPISNVDPEGDLAFLAAVGIGALVGVLGNGVSNAVHGNNFFDGAGKAALWGGIGAAASIGVGAIFGNSGSIFNELGRAGGHALSGGLQSHLQGGSFSQGLLSGGISSIVGSTLSDAGTGAQILGSGIGGGAGSVIGGGNFFSGFGQGIAVGAFNHALHRGLSQGPGNPPWDLNGDGRLSLSEANVWFRDGGGQAITVDAESVDLDFLNPADWKVNEYRRVQTLVESSSGRVYGNIDVTYSGNNRFTIGHDDYHFPHAPGSGLFRNFANWVGAIYAGNGTRYEIHFKGTNTVNYKPFEPKFVTGQKY